MKKFSLPKDGGLIETGLPKGILHSYERIPAQIFEDEEIASADLAGVIIDAINSSYGTFRLGLTTGTSPVTLYRELVRRHKAGDVSFANVEIFSIDEYYPAPAPSQSRNNRLYEELISKIDIRQENVHIPRHTEVKDTITEDNAAFDKLAKGLDLLVMGVGEKGQLGFNEAGSSEKSRTRSVLLSYNSRKRQSVNFNGEIDETPRIAITMGISTMLTAKRIILIAWGEDKAEIVRKIVEEKISPECPASYLQRHENISFYVWP